MSKRIWNHPEVPAGETTVSWRGVGQLEDTPAFRGWLEREFPRGAAELANEDEMETSRRSFLKLMGASTALAGFGMASCRRPEAYIVPYANAPEWVIPGKATYYATNMPRPHGATPMVVKTFEGRPTQLSPNERHPDAHGTDAQAQASILDLYNPYRSRTILRNGKAAKRGDLHAAIATLAANPAARIGFLFGSDDCPTRNRLIGELQGKFSGARFYSYEALDGNASAALGDGVRLVPDFERADKILSLDADFASIDPQGPVTAFFNRRKPEGADYGGDPSAARLNRLYVVESSYTLTGGMADHRLRAKPSEVLAIAAQIARVLGAGAELAGQLPTITDERQLDWIRAMAADLRESGGRSVVIAGSRQPAAVHHLALAINQALGSIGGEGAMLAVQRETTGLGDLPALVADMQAGNLDAVVLMSPSNPAFDAPADLKFAEALAQVPVSFHLGLRSDATAHAATWHIPGTHYLESWSDARSARGYYSVVQPMILPLYPECVSELDLLVALLGDSPATAEGEGENDAPAASYLAVRETFGGDDATWKNLLRDGFSTENAYPAATPQTSGNAGRDIAAAVNAASPGGLEVVFATDASIYDGRWIDNGWLQEAADPVTKLSWDNAALVAPKTAKELGIYDEIIALENSRASGSPDGEGENREAPVIGVEVNGVSLEIAVQIAFGQAEETIVLPVGYGQGFNEHDALGRGPRNLSHVGLVGVNTGFNVYPLRTSATPYAAAGAKVSLTGKRYPVAMVQEHFSMYGRALAREISTRPDPAKGTFEKQLANVKLQGMDSHAPPNISLYKPHNRDGINLINDPLHQWGMAIDLSSCMGCNACTIACQAENNIPIVGKEQVAKGREMHWIRLDRYYASQEYVTDSHGNRIKDEESGEYQKTPEWVRDNPAFVPQPVACVHCESAPCEVVCPVNATVHTEDGLNAMAYNRCIGTRYCANNCPYKVRRFNFFDYNKRNPLIPHNLYRGPLGEKQVGDGKHLQRNPNVTVRMRGVMEKCTYCVQRLKDAVIRQKRAHKNESVLSGEPSTGVEATQEMLRVPVGGVSTACQEACPADAITFGNLWHDDQSAMGRAKNSPRNYDLLHYIGTRPRTSYLARVKNPNTSMPDAPYVGQSTIHMV